MTRVSVALILVGILSLLAAPLATAQSSPEPSDQGTPEPGDRGATSRSAQRDAPAVCPDGFQLTEDMAYCYEQPVIVTTQQPVDCEVGHLTPNFAACYTAVSYISQAPSAELEIIDANVSPNPATITCPDGFELSPDQAFCQATTPGPAAPTLSDGEPYCADGSSVQPDGMCYVQGTTVSAGLYVPGMPATPGTPAMCPDGTDPAFIQNGLCKVSDASPLPTPCLDGELEILNIFDNGFERVVCFAGLPQIPAVAAVAATPATCEGEVTVSPASACIVTVDTSFPVAPLLTEREFLRCEAGFVLGAGEECFLAVAPSVLANPPTVTCPSGYAGPSLGDGPGAGYVCTRTVLTAQPDVPVCKAGTLLAVGPESPGLDTGDDFICLLDNYPVAPAPVSMPTCPRGDYSAKDDLCLLMPEGGKPPVGAIPTATPIAPPNILPPIPPPIPPIPGGPITDTLPFIVTAIGDQADAPPTWVFNIESNCLGGVTEFHVPTEDTFGAESFSEFPLEPKAADGTPCTYTITGLPYLDWLTNLPAEGYTFTPLETGVPLLFIEIYQPGVGQLLISKFTALLEGTSIPDRVEFTVTGLCLDGPLEVAIDTDGRTYTGTVAVVPSVDTLGNSCVYRVEATPFPGFEPITNPVEVVMSGNTGFVEFSHVPTDIDGGAITIHKESEGDPATAPPEWEFTITSICLQAPLVVTMPAAPTFTSPQVVSVDGLETNCEYMIEETPVDGYLIQGENYAYIGTAVPIGNAYFFNQQTASATGTISFFKEGYGVPEGHVFGFDVTSSCLEESLAVYVGIYDTRGNTQVDGLPLVDADGAACIYTITYRPDSTTSVLAGDETATINLLENDGYAFYGLAKITDDFAQPLFISKYTMGDPANAPETFELAVSSPCLNEPIILSVPAAETFGYSPGERLADLPVADADGAACEYTVTEPNHAGYTVIEPSPITLDGPYTKYAQVTNIEIGLRIGQVAIYKEAFGDPATAPEFWEFTISSPCFDPIVVQMPSAPTFDGYEVIEVGDLPISDLDGFCEVTITETPAVGFAISPPIVRSFEFGPYMGIDQIKVEEGHGYTSGIRVLKYGFDSIEATGPFKLVLESTCLEQPIIVEVDPATQLDDDVEVVFQELPVESGGELCVYDIAPVEVDGIEHSLQGISGPITLGPDLTLVGLVKGSTGSLVDVVTPIPAGSIIATPPVLPPTPSLPSPVVPTPSLPAPVVPAPTIPVPQPTPLPVTTVSVPVVSSVVAPASTAPVAVASVNFGGSTPVTPASMLGAGHNAPAHSGSSTTPLAHTGGEAGYLTMFGLTLITLGALMMLIGRRRVYPDPFGDSFIDPFA